MKTAISLTEEHVQSKILTLRNKRVILDSHLAEMYGVETKNLKRQVKRNILRFPSDFMFELTLEELYNLRCQIATPRIITEVNNIRVLRPSLMV